MKPLVVAFQCVGKVGFWASLVALVDLTGN